MSKKTPELPRGIRMRGTKYFVDVSVRGERKTATCNNLEDATAKREELLAQVERELAVGSGGVWSIKQAYEQTCKKAWADEPGTNRKYLRRNGNYAVKFFGENTPLRDIETPDIDRWMDKLTADGNGPATVNRKISALSKLFTIAIKYTSVSGVTSRPAFERQKEGKGRIRYLTDDEEQQILTLLAQWTKWDHVDYIACLLDIGARPDSELLQVEARDVNFQTNQLTLCGHEGLGTKNGTIRSIPMTDRVQAIMRRRTSGVKPTDKVFPYPYHWLRHMWARIRATLGNENDKDFVPYVCRHTFVSRLVMAKVDLKTVKELAGHEDIRMTMRYAHLAPETSDDAIKALNKRFYLPVDSSVAAE